MKTLLLALAFLPALAFAAPNTNADGITNMVAQCRCVMDGGVCIVSNRPAPRPGSRLFLGPGVVIDAQAASRVRDAADMCEAGRSYCTANWTGQECIFFRYRFRQEPVQCLVRP